MITPTHDYTWPQGSDLVFGFRYLEGAEGAETPVDLTGYTVRMDVVHPATKQVLFTFNTDEQEEPDEIVVNSGGTGRVTIKVPRGLTLPAPNGQVANPVHEAINDGTLTFSYDIFLRSPSNLQTKVYGGTIRVEPSHTLWS